VQTVWSGQSPSQVADSAQGTAPVQLQAPVISLIEQVCPAGHSPSQSGFMVSSQGIGTQSQIETPPTLLGMQIVPSGQSPSQVGCAD